MRRRRYLRWHLGATFAFLYLPIAVLVGLSFNDGGLPTAWDGASLRWYRVLLGDGQVLDAVRTTLLVAVTVTAIATPVGTLLAVGLQRTVRSRFLDTVLFLPAVIPDIVLAIGLLSFFNLLRVPLGVPTIVLAHLAFDVAFVASIVRTRLSYFDRSIEEAAMNLGASSWTTFRRVTFPMMRAGIVAAAHVGKVPPSLPSIRDTLGASLEQAGWLLSMVNLTAALGGMVIALTVDRSGVIRTSEGFEQFTGTTLRRNLAADTTNGATS